MLVEVSYPLAWASEALGVHSVLLRLPDIACATGLVATQPGAPGVRRVFTDPGQGHRGGFASTPSEIPWPRPLDWLRIAFSHPALPTSCLCSGASGLPPPLQRCPANDCPHGSLLFVGRPTPLGIGSYLCGALLCTLACRPPGGGTCGRVELFHPIPSYMRVGQRFLIARVSSKIQVAWIPPCALASVAKGGGSGLGRPRHLAGAVFPTFAKQTFARTPPGDDRHCCVDR